MDERSFTKDGETFHLNDCIFLDGDLINEPFFIGRIVEISTEDGQIKVNWFQRSKDVPHFKSLKGVTSGWKPTPRMLLATMHCDWNPIGSVRGKCQVSHRSEITDLEAFVKSGPCFYYWLLYDRFTRTIYDVIETSRVQHLPASLAKLMKPFKFVLMESGKTAEYAEVTRICTLCEGYVGSNTDRFLTCGDCGHHFHLCCFDPPMHKKPSRGYSWQCMECIKKYPAQINLITSETSEPQTDAENEEAANNGDKDMSEDDEAKYEAEIRDFVVSDKLAQLAKIWPFRYLGTYAREREDEYDDEKIFPYAQSRVGSTFQVPQVADEPNPNEKEKPSKKHLMNKKDKNRQVEELLWSKPERFSDEDYDQFIKNAGDLYEGCSDKQKAAVLSALHLANFDPAVALENLRGREKETTVMAKWSEEEKTRFTEGVRKFGKEPNLIKSLFPKKSPREIVEFFYLWKRMPAAQEFKKKNKELVDEEHPHHLHLTGILSPPRMTHSTSSFMATGTRALSMEMVDEKGQPLHHIKPEQGVAQVATPPSHPPPGAEEDKPALPSGATNLMSTPPHHEGKAAGRITQTPITCESCGKPDTPEIRYFGPKMEVLCSVCGIRWRKLGEAEINFPRVDLKLANGKEKDKNGESKDAKSRERTKERGKEKPKDKERDQDQDKGKEREKEDRDKAGDNGKEKDHDWEKDKDKDRDKEREKDKAARGSREGEDEKEESRRKRRRVDTPACAVCAESVVADDNKIITCSRCSLSVHQGCFGIPQKGLNERRWECHKCQNDLDPEAPKNYHCIFCPSKRFIPVQKPETLEHSLRMRSAKEAPQALKRTIENNWAHVTCALWIPEVKFGDPERLEPVENVGKIPKNRWKLTCSLCEQSEGVCLQCSERGCNKAFHVDCARQANFLLYPNVGGTKKPSLQIFCEKHQFVPPHTDQIKSSILRDFCLAHKAQEHAAGGMRRANSINLSVTCTCHMEKGPHPKPQCDENLGLSRVRALQMENCNAPERAKDVSCASCHGKHSPIWWDPPGEGPVAGGKLCQICYWKAKTSAASSQSQQQPPQRQQQAAKDGVAA